MTRNDFYELRVRNAFNEWAELNDYMDEFEDGEEPEWLVVEESGALERLKAIVAQLEE